MAVPGVVEQAKARAARAGFRLSCEDGVGQLLATLVLDVPPNGRVLELGTGVGVGTAWIVSGLESAGRTDVDVVTVDFDPAVSSLAASASWPAFVRLVEGDAVSLLASGSLGVFDLVFADAQGGKWEGLDRTIAALRPEAVLLVDDMRPQSWWTEGQRSKQELVRRTLLGHPDLEAIELDVGSGCILCTRR